MLLLSPTDAAALVALPAARAELSVLRDLPLVAIDLRPQTPGVGSPVGAPGAGHDLSLWATLPVVVAGVGDEHDATDVVVDDLDALARLDAAVRANPQAAVTLVQLLRLQQHLDPYDALVAESLAYATLQGGAEFAAWLAGRGARVRRAGGPPPLAVARDGTTLRLTFDRPRLYNLYDAATRDALVDALLAFGADASVERFVLAGNGRAFCAGGDLAEFGTTRDTTAAHLIRTTANAAPHLLAVAPRLEAEVHGACVGAGLELAAFAHRVRATPDAFFALPEVSMGLVPGAGGTVSVTRRIGRHRAAWLALTGERVDAATALSWGLVDDVVDEVADAR